MSLDIDAEAIFPPKPGGMVDSARRQQAKSAPAQEETSPAPRKPNAVKTIDVSASVANAGTVVVPTASYNAVRVLGFDKNRKRAVVMALDEPVVVATSASQADDPRNAGNTAGQTAGGFVLPVNTPLVIETASEVWVAATSTTATRVSFWSEIFSGQ